MRFLIYVSQADHPMSEAELQEILNYSRERNERDGLTGLLIYRYVPDEDRGSFLQLLEGNADALDATWQRIAADRRHNTKVVLEEGDIAARTCPDWTMGFRNVDEADLARFEGYRDLGSAAFWERVETTTPPDASELMRAFYEDS